MRCGSTPERVLLLGGSGFVGRHVLGALVSGGLEVVVASRTPGDSTADGIRIAGDLADPGMARSLLATVQPSVVINCAGANLGSVTALRRANVLVVRSLLTAMHASDRPPRLVQLGSAAEYGRVPGDRSIRETDPTNPTSPYGRSKLEATRAVLRSGEPPTGVVLRLFNVVGAGAPRIGLVGSAIRAMRSARATGAREVRLGALDAFRDFVHAADVAAAIVAAARTEAGDGLVMNVGSGQAMQTRTVIQQIAHLAAYEGQIVEVASQSSPRSGDIPWLEADISLAAKTLGWRPTRTLADALQSAWEDSEAEDSEPE